MSSENARPELPRRIGAWSAIAILVGTTIGSGIFRSPAAVADRLPATTPILAVWLVGGLLALCGALTLAELAGEYPETGGIYVFIREGWGPLPAFLFGWAELVVIRAAALGAIAMTFAEYCVRVFGNDPKIALGGGIPAASRAAQVHEIAAAAIIVVGALNYVGVRWGTMLQNALTVIKCGGLLALIVLSFVLAHFALAPAHVVALSHPLSASLPASAPSAPMITPMFTLAAFGLALISALWVYDGWADVSFVAGEIRDPERNLPRVLVFGTLAVIAIYLLANVAYLTILTPEEMRHSPLVAADVANRLMGTAGVSAIGIIVMLSSFGTLNGSMLTGPRVLWAMAHDGLLFRAFARVHPRFHTPSVAILVATVVGVVFVSLRSFEQLADTFVTAILPFYALAVAAIFPLRRRYHSHQPRTQSRARSQAGDTPQTSPRGPRFRAIGYPVTPILFIVATLALLGNALADPSAQLPTAIIFVVILAGIPVYRWIR